MGYYVLKDVLHNEYYAGMGNTSQNILLASRFSQLGDAENFLMMHKFPTDTLFRIYKLKISEED